MTRKRHTEEQIIVVLKDAHAILLPLKLRPPSRHGSEGTEEVAR